MKMDAAAFVADQKLVEALRNHSTPVVCQEDRMLFNQGDAPEGLYIFHKGVVRLIMHSHQGDELMNIPAREGSLLGLPGLIGGAPYSLSALAEKGAEVSFVSREDFGKIMLSVPTIAVGILRVLAAEVRTARMALVEG
jgi:CRP/FNR family transcriptional regulator